MLLIPPEKFRVSYFLSIHYEEAGTLFQFKEMRGFIVRGKYKTNLRHEISIKCEFLDVSFFLSRDTAFKLANFQICLSSFLKNCEITEKKKTILISLIVHLVNMKKMYYIFFCLYDEFFFSFGIVTIGVCLFHFVFGLICY